jgi:hypothetical protein
MEKSWVLSDLWGVRVGAEAVRATRRRQLRGRAEEAVRGEGHFPIHHVTPAIGPFGEHSFARFA